MSFTHLLLISSPPFSQLFRNEKANNNSFCAIGSEDKRNPRHDGGKKQKLRNKEKSCHEKAKGISDLIGSFHYTCKAIKSQMLTSAWHCATCAKADNDNLDHICWRRLHWYLAENHKHRWQIPQKIFTECDWSHLLIDNHGLIDWVVGRLIDYVHGTPECCQKKVLNPFLTITTHNNSSFSGWREATRP